MDQPTRTRGGNGKFTRSLETAERDAEAARLRSRGWSYRRIATELDLSVSNAHAAVERALRAIVEEPAQDVRRLELERLDQLWEAALTVLETEHVHVSGGKIVSVYETDDEGNPIVLDHDDQGKPIYKEKALLDDAPKLKAIETLLKIQARRAALLGLDAEKKVNLSGGVKYEIVGVDAGDLS